MVSSDQFAENAVPPTAETVPFARLVVTYQATDEQPVAVAADVSESKSSV